MNRSTSTLLGLMLLASSLLAGCVEERAAVTPQPTTFPLAPYGVPLAQGQVAPRPG